MPHKLLLLLAALLVARSSALHATELPPPAKPNIIFILADDK